MSAVELRDVTARDGLQDYERILSTDEKVALVHRLWDAGLRWVEATSFVSPKRVPQLADAAELCGRISPVRPRDALISAFVATPGGAERALAAGVGEISTAVPATDGMSQANFGRTSEQMVAEVEAIRSLDASLPMSLTVAVAFGCPYDGRVEPEDVRALVERAVAAGYDTVLLGDTIGVADPARVEELFASLADLDGSVRLGAHFHDARGAGVANAVAAVGAGATLVDAALGGLGGCPFAPGAAGNVAMEDVAWTLTAMGHETGVDPGSIAAAARWMEENLDIGLRSRFPAARPFEWELDAA